MDSEMVEHFSLDLDVTGGFPFLPSHFTCRLEGAGVFPDTDTSLEADWPYSKTKPC